MDKLKFLKYNGLAQAANMEGQSGLAEQYRNISSVSAPVVDIKKLHANLKTENMFGFYQR